MELTFELKDLLYLLVIFAGAISGHFSIKIKSTINKVEIENLKKRLSAEVKKTDTFGIDLKEAISLLMEIKGSLNK